MSEIEARSFTRLENPLSTDKYTTVFHERKFNFNAPHNFLVVKSDAKIVNGLPHTDDVVGVVHFQEGPIKEYGINGVANEDLLNMVQTRLEHFQRSDFSCKENAMAITKIEEALLWLRKRTMGREQRGVEGTHVK